MSIHLTSTPAATPSPSGASAEVLYDRITFVLDAVLPAQLDRELTREELLQLDHWLTQVISEAWADYRAVGAQRAAVRLVARVNQDGR